MIEPTRGLTGRTLGDFTVQHKIGEGGHGVVYRAEQRALGREAVIKVLHARFGASDNVVQRFLREAQLASRLDHPYAAHIYAFGAEPDGLLWIAMELVRGTILRKVLESQPGGRLPLPRMVALLDGLCEVVHTAHEQGIVHRDLKPDNIMVLSRAGRLLPKLLDLGIAKLVDGAEPPATAPEAGADALAATLPPAGARPVSAAATQQGAVIGSPHYMAPEQWIDGGEIDARTDVYALGVVTYEMLAGKVPFTGGSLAEIARGHLRGEPPPLPADVPAELAAVVRRALAKPAADRYPTALAFAEAVRAAAGLRLTADALPRLDDALRAEIAWLPQPIADAVATLEAARNPHQARDALWGTLQISVRWLAIVALAARSRIGARPGGDAPAVTEMLRELHRRDLDDEEWLELVRALVAPFAGLRDAYPIPELVDLALAEPSPFQPLFALHAGEGPTTSEESLRDRLARTLPVLAPLLRAMSFLASYQLVVPRGDRADVWMGTRRSARPVIAIAAGFAEGEPVLVDFDGAPVLALAPLVQIASPSPGAADELFVFAGAGRVRGHGARLVAEPHGFERHDDAVWAWFRRELVVADDAAATTVEAAPYLGLQTFTEADTGVFFGRERAVEAFVNQLRVQPLLAVVGPSGTGKSSFVRAGVLPALPDGWRGVVLRPGATPSAVLARIASPGFAVRSDAERRGESIESPGFGETLVIVVDQLEEMFTLCRDPAERDRFADALAARAGDERTRVVLTIRDDFLARAGELAALRERLANAVTLLATPADGDLLRVLVEPARRAGYDFDDGLPQDMVRTVRGQPGALALLSFTALELWSLRDRHFKRLTRKAYDAIGGVEGALAQHAEATLRACTAEEQRLVREAFRHLVTAEGTRAVLSRGELEDVLEHSPHAASVIERLVGARLLVVAEGEAGDERIEIVHEALLTAWPRLVDWRRDDAEGARLRDQLRAAARQWDDRGRPRGLLWRGEALDDYVRWRSRRPGALPELDRAFGEASVRDARRGRRIRSALAATAATVLVAGVIALSVLYRSSSEHAVEASENAAKARDNAKKASENAAQARAELVRSWVHRGQQYLLDGDYQRALPFLAAAYDGGDRSRAVKLMLHRAMTLAKNPRIAQSHSLFGDPAFRPDGNSVVAVGDDGSVLIVEPTFGRISTRLAGVPGGHRFRSAISGDGSLVATARGDSVLVWDGAATRTIAVGAELADNRTRLALDATGARLAVAVDRKLSVWDARSSAQLWSRPISARPRALRWVGDAVFVIDADDNAQRLTANATTSLNKTGAGRMFAVPDDRLAIGGARTSLYARDGSVARTIDVAAQGALAISPVDDQVAVADLNGSVTLNDKSGKVIASFAGHTAIVRNLRFARGGKRLITSSDDGTVRVWDVASRRELVRYVGIPGGGALGLDVSADGTRIAVLAPEELRLFPVDDPSAIRDIDTGEVLGVGQLVAGGSQIFTNSQSGIELWDATSGARRVHVKIPVSDGAHPNRDLTLAAIPVDKTNDVEIVELPGGARRTTLHAASPVTWAEFDPSGSRVITAAKRQIEVWRLDGTREMELVGHNGPVNTVAFSADGGRIVSASNDTTSRVWDAATGRQIAELKHDEEVHAARFDRTGARVITGSAGRALMIWDVSRAQQVRLPQTAPVNAVAIDDDRDLAVAGTIPGLVEVWDLRARLEIGNFRHADSVTGTDVAGDRLMTTGFDGHLVMWDIGTFDGSPGDLEGFLNCYGTYVLRDDELIERDTFTCAP